MITQDQLKDVLDRADALYKYLKIDEKKIEFEEEDLRTQAPDFWEDQKRAEEQMKKVKGIKVFMPDGKRIKAKKKYKMACNSFVAAICDAPRGDQGEANGLRCSDILIKFLDGHAPIDYHDTRCATVINPPKTE